MVCENAAELCKAPLEMELMTVRHGTSPARRATTAHTVALP